MVAYDGLDTWRPDAEKDLLAAHRLLMAELIDECGAYRSGGVGVMAGAEVIHMAPPAKRVPELMRDLFQWVKDSDQHPLFADIPVESLIYKYQSEYYQALQDATEQSDSACFIEFMLTVILDVVGKGSQVSDQVEKLLAVMGDGWLSTQEMMARLGLSHKATFRKNYLRPVLQVGLVVMQDPDSPRSPKQKYRKVV